MKAPNTLACPDVWPYDEGWKKSNNWDQLTSVCGHTDASFQAQWYVHSFGEAALTKVRCANSYLQKIVSGEIKVEDMRNERVSDYTAYDWRKLAAGYEPLMEGYNLRLAPPSVLAVIEEVRRFIDLGWAHRQTVVEYMDYLREIRRAEIQRLDDYIPRDVVAAGVKLAKQKAETRALHMAVEVGYVYLLSNELMPGICKIGFTGGDPTARARKVSQHHKLPKPFVVAKSWRTKDPYSVEQRIHSELRRFWKASEFFEVDRDLAYGVIENQIITPDL